ncbi:MAG: transglycosylase SLT domain-containing protein [candidate division Zixibacteria bacterium]|nr:transglycosylase SLT domain-containing protein [candidate division Zixibacteria bacterium]
MALGVKFIRKSGILVSKFISVLLVLLYLGQSALIIYLIHDRYELQGILREQQLKMNELEEKLKILDIIEEFQVGFKDGEVAQLTQVIHNESKKYGYDPLLILALILTESSFRKGQVSEMGALGLMQVKPSVGCELCQRRGLNWKGELSLFEPAFNVQLGTLYLFELILKFKDVKKAIIAYNLGENALKLRLKEGQGLPTYYLSKVLKKYKELKGKYDRPKG